MGNQEEAVGGLSEKDSKELVETTIATRVEMKRDRDDIAMSEFAEGSEIGYSEKIAGELSSASKRLAEAYEETWGRVYKNKPDLADKVTELAKKIDREIRKVPGGVVGEELSVEAGKVFALVIAACNDDPDQVVKFLTSDKLDYETLAVLADTRMSTSKTKKSKEGLEKFMDRFRREAIIAKEDASTAEGVAVGASPNSENHAKDKLVELKSQEKEGFFKKLFRFGK